MNPEQLTMFSDLQLPGASTNEPSSLKKRKKWPPHTYPQPDSMANYDYQAPPADKIYSCLESWKTYARSLRVPKYWIFCVIRYPDFYWHIVRNNDTDKRIFSLSRDLEFTQKRLLNYIIIKLSMGIRTPARTHEIRNIGNEFATAYSKRNNIVRNALRHKHHNSSLVLDLKNAFESVTSRHIEKFLIRQNLFNGLDRSGAWLLSRLFTYRGKLRRGSPISPILFNLMMAQLDHEIWESLKREDHDSTVEPRSSFFSEFFLGTMIVNSVTYSRYGDDLCFSSSREIFPEWAKERILTVVKNWNLEINWTKTREGRKGILAFPGVVIVNHRIQPERKYLVDTRIKISNGSLDQQQLNGHIGFVNQFPRSGRRAAYKKLGLPNQKTKRRQRIEMFERNGFADIDVF